jgi:hypothetical protein
LTVGPVHGRMKLPAALPTRDFSKRTGYYKAMTFCNPENQAQDER